MGIFNTLIVQERLDDRTKRPRLINTHKYAVFIYIYRQVSAVVKQVSRFFPLKSLTSPFMLRTFFWNKSC